MNAGGVLNKGSCFSLEFWEKQISFSFFFKPSPKCFPGEAEHLEHAVSKKCWQMIKEKKKRQDNKPH